MSCRYQLNKSKFLNPVEVENLEAICRRGLHGDNPRDPLMIMLALKTGARATELLNLKANDYDPRDKTVFIRGIKGSNDREIPIPDFLAHALDCYLKRHREEILFPICYHRLKQIWDLYRPNKKKFHALRHTFALVVYEKTRDLKLTQTVLGHRNISNTMIYLDFVYSKKELKRIL